MYRPGKNRPVLEIEQALKELNRVTVWDSKDLSAEIVSVLTGQKWDTSGHGGAVMIHQGRTAHVPNILCSVDAIFEITAKLGFRPGSLTLLMEKAVEAMPRWTTNPDNPLSEREALPVAMVWMLVTEEVVG